MKIMNKSMVLINGISGTVTRGMLLQAKKGLNSDNKAILN